MNIPDNWVIVKIKEDNDTYFFKVLAGWSGGYLDGDSWKLNSRIVKVEVHDNYYDFIGETGSVYRCHKSCEFVRMNIGGILGRLIETGKVTGVAAEDIIGEFE